MLCSVISVKRMKGMMITRKILALSLVLLSFQVSAAELPLNEKCVVNILNRTVNVQKNGAWFLPNVPANLGKVRARATCLLDGETIIGATDFFTVDNNTKTAVPKFFTAEDENDVSKSAPINISLLNATTDEYVFDESGWLVLNQKSNKILLNSEATTYQLDVEASYPNNLTVNITNDLGLNFWSSNQNIVSVSENGLVTAQRSGVATVFVAFNGVGTSLRVEITLAGDADGDGLPDDYEEEVGLNPNDPVDAFEDPDNDGLSTLEEYNAGTNPLVADSDDDGVSDGEELKEGADGFITDPLLADSDGDGLSDGVEVLAGSDPTDETDTALQSAIVGIEVSPASLPLVFDTIRPEASARVRVEGVLVDGSRIDLTERSSGTNYSTSDQAVASFGIDSGEIFAGQAGAAVVTITNGTQSVELPVTVESFAPTPLTYIDIPTFGNNVDIEGDYAFVAGGAGGIYSINTSDKTAPFIEATLPLPGNANDIKVRSGKAFIAAGDSGLHIVDISSPAEPALLSTLDTPGTAIDVVVQGNFAYIADSDAGIHVIDVSDSEVPFITGSYDTDGTANGLDVDGDVLVVSNFNKATSIIDVSEPSTPVLVAKTNVGANSYDVQLQYPIAYMATNNALRVIDLTEVSNPVLVGNFGSGLWLMDLFIGAGDLMFASQVRPDTPMPILNISTPDNPVFPGNIIFSRTGAGSNDVTGLAADNNYVYATGGGPQIDYKPGPNRASKFYIGQYSARTDYALVPPEITLTSPVESDVAVEGQPIVFSATASDDVAVSYVEFVVDGEVVFRDSSEPYQFEHTIPLGTDIFFYQARAVDLGGNVGATETIDSSVQLDTDRDGLGDEQETDVYFTEPTIEDSDDDGLLDGREIVLGTDPNLKDSDDDGIEDGAEVLADTDPLNPDVTPISIVSVSPEANVIDVCESTFVSITFNDEVRRRSVAIGDLVVKEKDTNIVVTGNFNFSADNYTLNFYPTDLLSDNTLHEITLSSITDDAGNPLDEALISEFTTGNCIDLERPYVEAIVPADEYGQAPLNTKLSIRFNEPLKEETVNDTSVRFYDTVLNEYLLGILSLDDDKRTIVFQPNNNLAVSREYRIYFSGIKDLFDNVMYSTSSDFTTSFEDDVTAPEVTKISIPDNAVDVPLNPVLRVQFSEPVNSLTLSGIKLLLSDGTVVAVQSRELLSDNVTVQLNLPTNQLLLANNSYQLVIADVEDLAGQKIAEVQSTFTTGAESDTTRGTILNWSFASNVDLPLNPLLEVEFSERVDITTVSTNYGGTFYLYNYTQSRAVLGHAELGADGRTLRFVPDEALQGGHRYRLYVSYSSRIYDLAGNYFSSTYRYFNATFNEDSEAPSVALTSLDSSTEGVPVNSKLTFIMDEPVSATCIDNLVLSDGVNSVDVTTSLASDQRTVTITPVSDLVISTEYTLSLNGLCDTSGNLLSGVALTFTTADTDVADNSGPVLQSIDPAYNETVSLTPTITMVYNEPVNLINPPYVYGAGVTVYGDYTLSGNTITFTPASPLVGDTRYRVYYRATDLAGNRGSNSSSYFYTEPLLDTTPPTVIAIAPETNAVDVSPLAGVVLSFNEPMNPSTVNSSNIKFYADGELISPSVYRSVDGQQVTLSASLPSESIVSVVVTDRVTDLSGNPVAPYTSSFTTALLNTDNSRPSVSRVLPGSGTTGWVGINEVVMYVSEPLDNATVADAFHIAENGELIDDQGVLEVLGSGQTLRFTKSTPFTEGALVEVFLSDLATDNVGNPLNNYSAYFTMGDSSDGAGVGPYPSAYSRNYDLPLNPAIQVLYTEPLDPTSLTEDNVTLYSYSTGSYVPVTISLNTEPGDIQQDSKPGYIVTIQPQELLAPDTTHYLYLNAAIQDTDGDSQPYSYGQYFYTATDAVEDDRAPQVIALSPPDGQAGVGVNPFYAARFDEPVNGFALNSVGDVTNLQFSEDNQVVRYERLGTLPINTEITESLPVFSDLSGNLIPETSTTFTTLDGPDLVSGALVASSIEDGEINVPLNPVLVREFDEPLDPVSITESGVYLYDTTTGERVDSTVSLSADGKRLILVPVEALAPGRRYYWYWYSLRDLSGNVINGSYYYYYYYDDFTTGFAEDYEAPVLESMTVFEGQEAVPTNVVLRAQFSEPLNPVDLSGVTLTNGVETVVTEVSLSSDRRTVILVPKSLLDPNSNYTFTVSGIEDISGNEMVAPMTVSFVTGDSIDSERGSIIRWSFASNTTVALNPLLEVELSERIDASTITTDYSGSFYLYSNTQSRTVLGHAELSADGRTLRFIPDEALHGGHTYRLYVGYSPYLHDMAGNYIYNSSRYFTTSFSEDSEAPEVTLTSLDSTSVDVPVNSQISFVMDEAVSETCLSNLVLSDGANNIGVSASLASDQRTVTVTPVSELATSTEYTLSLDGLCDTAGNVLSGVSLTLITSASDVADTSGPVLQSIDPAYNETVSLTPTITMVYNEPVNLINPPYVYGAGVTVYGDYSLSGNTITFTPASPLVGDTRYRVYYRATDLAGNRGSNSTSYFYTEPLMDTTPPAVVAIAPETNAVDVSPLVGVVLSFNEPMNPNTVNSTNIKFYANGQLISPSVYRSVDGQQVTLSASLPSESIVSVVVTDGVTDLSGNPIAPYTSSFTTTLLDTDNSRPSISRVLPGSGTSGWVGIDEVVMYANEPLDSSSIADAFHIAENGVLIGDQGVHEVLGNGQTLRFTKSTPFAEGALVEVFMSDQATDAAGNPLNNYSAYFTMGGASGGVGTGPYPEAYSRNSGLPLNPAIQVLYSEPLDSASLTDSNITLYSYSTNSYVPISISLNTEPGDIQQDSKPGYIVTIQPQELLDPNTTHYLYLNASIQDTDGDTQPYSYGQYFYTASDAVEDDRAPQVIALSPPDGQTGVGVNPYYAARFDEPINGFAASFGEIEGGSLTNTSVHLASLQFSEDNQVVRYERLGTLPENSEIIETLPVFADLGGNLISEATSTFTTGSGPDLTSGAVTVISVADNATNVPLNPILIREFDEPLDPVSVTESGVYLYDTTTGARVDTTLSLSADGKRLTMVPVEALDSGRRYYWYWGNLRDLSGNLISYSYYYYYDDFTTGSAVDTTAPVFESMTISDGLQNVPTNVRLRAAFDEPLNPLALSGVALTDTNGSEIVSTITLSSDRRSVSVVPKSLLQPLTQYTLTVAALEDVSGNVLTESVVASFTTGESIDSVRGSITRWSFQSNVELPSNRVLEVELSERVDPTTIDLTDSGSFFLDNSTTGVPVQGRAEISADGRVLRFVPNEVLTVGHTYRLYVGYHPYLYDLAGNTFSNSYRYFTAGAADDTASPALLSATLQSGMTNVPTNVRVNLQFSEPMNIVSAAQSLAIYDGLDNLVSSSLSYNSAQNLITLQPSSNLFNDSDYYIVLSGIEDYAGNSYSASSIPFVTGAGADTTYGNIQSWSFANNAELSRDVTLEVVLDEPVDITTVDAARFYLRNLSTGSNVDASISISSDLMTLMLDPTELLDANSSYRLYVSYSYFYDLAGNRINRSYRNFVTTE